MNFAIILAGGSGKRVGSDIPKQYIEINGKPLLYYTIRAFENSDIDRISIVADKEHMSYVVSEIIDKYNFKKVFRVCEGGTERFFSALHGLDDIKDAAASPEDVVLIHDGARPFIESETINEVTAQAKRCGAAIAAMPVKDTIKIAAAVSPGEDGAKEYFVKETTQRPLTWQIQTPQGFNYQKLFTAYSEVLNTEKAEPCKFTDDSMVWEKAYGSALPVRLVEASYKNIKITTSDDLEVAKVGLI